jgi:hypothetical protein
MPELPELKDLISAKDYGPFVAVLVGAGAVLGVYAQVRTLLRETSRRFREIDERTKAVAFWHSWVRAQASVSSVERLDEVRAIARRQLDALGEDLPGPAASIGALQRFFLLYVPPSRRFWVYRAPYYLCALLSVYLLWALAVDISDRRYSLVTFIVVAVTIMITSLVWMATAAVERRSPAGDGAAA